MEQDRESKGFYGLAGEPFGILTNGGLVSAYKERDPSQWGNQLLEKYAGKVLPILLTLYPQHEWKYNLFKLGFVPKSYWDSMDNQIAFLTQLGVERYDGSLLELFQAIYPQHPWSPSKFPQKHFLSQT